MKNIFNYFKKVKRKHSIEAIKVEKITLKNLLFDALSERGDLNKKQRSEVLLMLVQEWKEQEQNIEDSAKKEFLKSEESNDVSKTIMLSTFF